MLLSIFLEIIVIDVFIGIDIDIFIGIVVDIDTSVYIIFID